jgi:hypothetical protein
MLNKLDVIMWNGLDWLRNVSVAVLVNRTFEFYKNRGNLLTS